MTDKIDNLYKLRVVVPANTATNSPEEVTAWVGKFIDHTEELKHWQDELEILVDLLIWPADRIEEYSTKLFKYLTKEYRDNHEMPPLVVRVRVFQGESTYGTTLGHHLAARIGWNPLEYGVIVADLSDDLFRSSFIKWTIRSNKINRGRVCVYGYRIGFAASWRRRIIDDLFGWFVMDFISPKRIRDPLYPIRFYPAQWFTRNSASALGRALHRRDIVESSLILASWAMWETETGTTPYYTHMVICPRRDERLSILRILSLIYKMHSGLKRRKQWNALWSWKDEKETSNKSDKSE